MIRAQAAVPVRRYSIRSAATVIAVAAALAGCGGTDLPGAESATARPSTPAATTAPAASPADLAGQQAITAYLGMWQDYVDAGTTSDWRSPALARNATGDALSTMSRGLYADHYNGLVSRGRPIDHPQVSSVDPEDNPTTVVISDCGDSTNWITVRADNGQPANDGPGGRRQINAIVKKVVDGSWKVADFGIQPVGTC